MSEHEDLRRRTTEAAGRSAAVEAAAGHRVGAGPGDLYVFCETAEQDVEWAVIAADGARWLVVPADTMPLVGSADVAVTSADGIGPLSLRCGFGLWLDAACFASGRRTATLPAGVVATVTENLDRREPPGLARRGEVDRDPEYEEWEGVLAQARQALARRGEEIGREKAMQTQEWLRIKEIAFEVLEREPAERVSYLEEACAGDEDLRAEVDSLLAQEEDAADLLERPLFERRDDEGPPSPGQIGAYKLRRRIGRGGMGEVYLAERADDQFRQRVAIKVTKPGMDTEEILRRFRDERQILASLEHPNITRLLDGGTTGDGRPYFVMDYVEGEPIHRWCEKRELGVRRRLELFLGVLSAVDYAHRHFVVHRDLKPGNILVTPDGTVKLLDFGIARVFGPDESSGITRLGERRLTPEYASPEQLEGKNVNTTSDVYSLGVLLYQLLTRRRPFAGEGSTTDALLLTMRGRDPQKPSTVDEAGELARHLQGDLDAIVLKALRYEPEERYRSVHQLAEDIERHLAGQPVTARQKSWLYLTSRTLKRHWGKASVAAVVVLLLAGLVRERQQTALEQEKVVLEQEQVRRMGQLLQTTFLGSDPGAIRGERAPDLQQVLKWGTEAVSQWDVHSSSRSDLLNTLARIHRGLGFYQQAEELQLENLELCRELYGPRSAPAGVSLSSLSSIYLDQGEYRDAERSAREGLDILTELYREDHRDVAMTTNNLAAALKAQGSFKDAADHYRESLEMKRRLSSSEKTISTALNNLGSTYAAQGEFAQADELYREALEIRQRIQYRAGVATTLHTLGVLNRDSGELEVAEKLFEESYEMRRSIYGPRHNKVASVARSRGVGAYLRGELEGAAELYGETLEIQREIFPEDHPEIAKTLRELSTLEASQGELDAAVEHAEQALAIFRERLPADHWQIADVENVLGGHLLALGQRDKARELLERSTEILRRKEGPYRETSQARERAAALGLD